MPTYEYVCRDCGEHVEVVQSFRDDPLTECGLCSGTLRKVFGAAGIIFKGSGYYVTDSRPRSSQSSSQGGDGEKKSAATGSEATSSSSSESSAAAESA